LLTHILGVRLFIHWGTLIHILGVRLGRFSLWSIVISIIPLPHKRVKGAAYPLPLTGRQPQNDKKMPRSTITCVNLIGQIDSKVARVCVP